jgi:hypothetical protein
VEAEREAAITDAIRKQAAEQRRVERQRQQRAQAEAREAQQRAELEVRHDGTAMVFLRMVLSCDEFGVHLVECVLSCFIIPCYGILLDATGETSHQHPSPRATPAGTDNHVVVCVLLSVLLVSLLLYLLCCDNHHDAICGG